MSAEHVSMRRIDGYARGDADLAADELWAVEAHLEACGTCRARLARAVAEEAPATASLVETVWSGLEPRLETAVARPSRRRLPARLAVWLTPVMAPWLAMTLGVTAIALLLDTVGLGPHVGEVSLVLLFAPVLPLCGVAASWSRGLDPAFELTACVPRTGLHLVLRRTLSVLAVTIPPLFVAGELTGVAAAQWLLPCLAFTAAALALGGVVGVTRAVLVLVAVWAAVILAPTLATSRTSFALHADGLPVWGACLVLGVGVLLVRRGAYSTSHGLVHLSGRKNA
ncbi:zf-HC2 domain-containing protein [Streptomyces sp. PU-14G]|uniref:zf-HC2 domain-containing protein n=1 Tax=Streptomyces sp. PU-14G TaxID=2800808 RepID=UPI0034DFF26D